MAEHLSPPPEPSLAKQDIFGVSQCPMAALDFGALPHFNGLLQSIEDDQE